MKNLFCTIKRLFKGSEHVKEQVEWLPLAKVFPNPYQSRRLMDEEALSTLMASVRTYGVIVPVLVRPFVNGYQVVAGERRIIAARQLGLTRIPAIVRNFRDEEALEVSFVENFHRVNLSELDHAAEVAKLAKRLGIANKNKGALLNNRSCSLEERMERTNLPPLLRKGVELEIVSLPIAKELALILDSETQLAFIEQVYQNKFSLANVQGIVRSYLGRGNSSGGNGNCMKEDANNNEAVPGGCALMEKEEKRNNVVNEVRDKESLVQRVLARVGLGGVPEEYTVELEDALHLLEEDYTLLRKFGRSAVCQLGESLGRLYVRQSRTDFDAMEVYEFLTSYSHNEQFLLWLCKAYLANRVSPPGAEQMFRRLLEQGLWEQLTVDEKRQMERLLLEEFSGSSTLDIYKRLLTEGARRRG